MEFHIVPFTANISRGDSAATVASQMQQIIDRQVFEGWEYVRMDGIDTRVAGDKGCFGIGAQPGFTTTYNVLVFKRG